jgi:hypothetical protein
MLDLGDGAFRASLDEAARSPMKRRAIVAPGLGKTCAQEFRAQFGLRSTTLEALPCLRSAHIETCGPERLSAISTTIASVSGRLPPACNEKDHALVRWATLAD